MSLGLLGSYGSDNDSSDQEDNDVCEGKTNPVNSASDLTEQAQVSNPFFVDANGSSSSDDEAEDRSRNGASKGRKNEERSQDEPPAKKRLPSAASVLKNKHITSSVFVSQHQREENDHNAKLSQHVPLTEQMKTGKSKQICKAFRRGDCRRGEKCKFTHPPPATATQIGQSSVQGGAKLYTSANDVFQKKMPKKS